MSTADDAWQEWLDSQPRTFADYDHARKAGFMAGYRRALEDAQQVIAGENSLAWARGAWGSSVALPHAIELIDDLIDSVGTKDGDDDAPHVHQWRTFRPYNQPAYQSCAGCGNVIPAPKDDR